MAGIYTHIPFCKSRCAYCAFFSTSDPQNAAMKDRYADAMCNEMKIRLKNAGTIQTLYIGGGTPSQMSLEQLERIIRHIPHYKTITERTIECNPDDITEEFARGLNRLGFNRISIGVQTFNDNLLKSLNRRHTAEKALEAIHMLRNAGFDNISADLMYGLPGQSPDDVEKDLTMLLTTGVEHVSSYCLSYEKGTLLYKKLKDKDFPETDEETELKMYNIIIDRLLEAGFEHYEISNFAKPRFRSQHNSNYWNGTPYTGIGAGAHSYDGNMRSWNVCSIEKYIHGYGQNAETVSKDVQKHEILSDTDKYNELVMTRLRTRDGLADKLIPNKFRVHFNSQIQPFIASGDIITETDGYGTQTYRLTKKALFISDSIISSLFIV